MKATIDARSHSHDADDTIRRTNIAVLDVTTLHTIRAHGEHREVAWPSMLRAPFLFANSNETRRRAKTSGQIYGIEETVLHRASRSAQAAAIPPSSKHLEGIRARSIYSLRDHIEHMALATPRSQAVQQLAQCKYDSEQVLVSASSLSCRCIFASCGKQLWQWSQCWWDPDRPCTLHQTGHSNSSRMTFATQTCKLQTSALWHLRNRQEPVEPLRYSRYGLIPT
jgi:hypothetical protein